MRGAAPPRPAAAGVSGDGPTGGAALRYVTDTAPGITRVHRGEETVYLDPDGREIADAETLTRIRSLVIPPAWTDVWICPRADGHIQAIGRDARRRKQYRYHPEWRQARDETKFARLALLGGRLAKLRRQVERDLASAGLSRRRVLAAVVSLLDLTGARVGNEEYRRANRSFGLTTLRNRHATFERRELVLSFRGKSGVEQRLSVRSARLARIVQRCQELPGQQLFQYREADGVTHPIDSDDVNAYLRELTGEETSAKDLRTWHASVAALEGFLELGPADSATAAERAIPGVVDLVAQRLHNTRATCRKFYIHPRILEVYIDGRLFELAARRAGRPARQGLSAAESLLLSLLALPAKPAARVGKSRPVVTARRKASA